MGVFFKNENWHIDYRLPNGSRRREKVGPSKGLAEIVFKKRMVEIAEGRFLDKKSEDKIKFEVFADEYLELHSKVNNKSWKKSDCNNLKILKEHFSGKSLSDITPLLIDKFKAERIKKVKPATVNRSLECLKSLFNKAIAWQKFAGSNPVKQIKLLKENNKRLRFLEREEIVKLLSNCQKYLKPIVVIALNTGMRRGEILGLKWRDIDIKRGIIYLYNTKNGEKREVPVNEQVKTALIRTRKHPQSEYIFCNKDGSRMTHVSKSFATALRKSGIKDFKFHDMRHTFASHLVMAGVDLNTVRELLGHKSLAMTLRYSHLSPDFKKRAVDVLSKKMDTFWTPSDQSTKQASDTINVTESITSI
jgi:integrase